MGKLTFTATPTDGFRTKANVPFLGSICEICIWPEPAPKDDADETSAIVGRGVEHDVDRTVERDAPTARQLAAAQTAMNWPREFIETVDDAAEANRRAVDQAVDLSEYDLGHIQRENIRQHYAIHLIAIPPLNEVDDPHHYIWLVAGCDWEEEHGLSMLIRNQEILYEGADDGLYLNANWPQWDDMKKALAKPT